MGAGDTTCNNAENIQSIIHGFSLVFLPSIETYELHLEGFLKFCGKSWQVGNVSAIHGIQH